MLTVAVRWITSACTRGGGIVWDDGCVTRAARVMRVVRPHQKSSARILKGTMYGH